MVVRKREGWRKEIGVAIAPQKRGRSATEEEENEFVYRIPDTWYNVLR